MTRLSSQSACTLCPAGSFCIDATSKEACPEGYFSGEGEAACTKCPKGTKCPGTGNTVSSIIKCANGEFSSEGSAACTASQAGQYVKNTDDTAGTDCPQGFFSADGPATSCTPSPSGKAAASAGTTDSALATCTSSQISAVGSSECTTCNEYEQCHQEIQGKNISCEPGYYYDNVQKTCVQSTSNLYQTIDSRQSFCPEGFMRSQTANDPEDTEYQCLECPDTQVCLILGESKWENNWCYLKDPDVDYSSLGLLVNQERIPAYHYKWCIDCNDITIKDSLCTFATNYFTTQQGTNITCPERSLSVDRTVGATTVQAKAQFSRTTNGYEYPYCATDLTYYTGHAVVTTSPTETYAESCAVPYYQDLNYNQCKFSYPGFLPATSVSSPTGQRVTTTTYSQLRYTGSSIEMTSTSCPSGTSSILAGGVNELQACRLLSPGKNCLSGDYCQDGTSFVCPLGFTQDTTTKTTMEDCKPCVAGTSCGATRDKTCQAGYHCPAYTEDPQSNPTPPGTFQTAEGSSTIGGTICTGGYCPPGSSSVQQCKRGYTATLDGLHSEAGCRSNDAGKAGINSCAQGYYCPEATQVADSGTSGIPCPPGTKRTSTGGTNVDSCEACEAGKFCPSATSSTTGLTCGDGAYCPARTIFSEWFTCPAGTRSPQTNNAQSESDCLDCPSGSFCKEGTSYTAPQTCPLNTYCPVKSNHYLTCPAGKYTSATGQSSESDCTSCTAGSFCSEGVGKQDCPGGTLSTASEQSTCQAASEGTSTSVGSSSESTCSSGTFSRAKASSCFSCPEGKACNNKVMSDCAAGEYSTGGQGSCTACQAGTHCPSSNLVAATDCPPGKTCSGGTNMVDVEATKYTTGGQTVSDANSQLCKSGYTCPNSGAIGPYDQPCNAGTFLDGSGTHTTCQTTSNGKYTLRGAASEIECPQGFYCSPSENYMPIPCPKGTFGASTNLQSSSECTACPGGRTCDLPGLTAAYGFCDEGYYCTGGAWTPRPDDTVTEEKATGGLCTEGHFCPQNSDSQTACPAGKYLSSPGMIALSDCLDCPPGSYCDTEGRSTPTGQCQAGFYCTGGSSVNNQVESPAGSYSPSGSAMSIKCPPGTFSDAVQASSCKTCIAGEKCPDSGMTAGTACAAGEYCPEGSVSPIPCNYGTYQPTPASSGVGSCLACDEGKVCSDISLTATDGVCEAGYICKQSAFTTAPAVAREDDTADFGLCRSGYYCQVSGGITQEVACEKGTYNKAKGATSSSFCLQCPAGSYCFQTGKNQPAGYCDSGYYCGAGSQSSIQNKCPAGHKCPSNSPTPTICPAGSYQPQEGQSTCIDCTAGNYCPEGATSQTVCPENHYCGAQVGAPTACAAGYSTSGSTGQTASESCTSLGVAEWIKLPGHATADNTYKGTVKGGYENSAGGATDEVPTKATFCAVGKLCSGGVATNSPEGYYAADEGLDSSGAQGHTSTAISTAAVYAKCRSGHYCPEGASSPVPTKDNTGISVQGLGGFCPTGFYCQEGTGPVGGTGGALAPVACPSGTVSSGIGLSTEAQCQTCPPGYSCSTNSKVICSAGKYCPSDSGIATVGTEVACPVGFFCSQGSVAPEACPGGSYQPSTDQSSCTTCSAGNYCPFNQASGTTSETTCPAGHQCSGTGNENPVPCQRGYYQDSTGQTSCKDCPTGHYCDQIGMTSPTQCPAGYTCTQNSVAYHLTMCQSGTYCPAGSSTATDCDGGKFCQGSALGAVSGDCLAGFYCIGKASQPNPTDGHTGALCPQGSYCPAGSSAPTACPTGTYGDKKGASAVSECVVCQAGLSCTETGLTKPQENCGAGKYCTCVSGSCTENECAKGHYCPEGEAAQMVCPKGTYQPSTGQSTCLACPTGSYCSVTMTVDSKNVEVWGGATTSTTCPLGFYCPAGTANSKAFACPAGTLSSSTGLKAESECTPCPEKSYCDKPAATAASGSCQDGYLCAAGSSLPTGSEACPLNHYCVAGTATECPAGTFILNLGSVSADECIKCPPGWICENHQLNMMLCPAGKVCPGGVASQSDSLITECPVGHYCPEGSAVAKKCLPGSYQPNAGQGSCITCPVGSYCPDIGATSHTTCPDQRVCGETGLTTSSICAAGEYMNSETKVCDKCAAGKYCWPGGLPTKNQAGEYVFSDSTTVVSADCNTLYVCQSGSTSPTPYPSQTSGIADLSTLASSDSMFSTYNGPSLPGYSSNLAKGNVECKVGTYKPTLYGSDCLECPDGYQCDQTAMSSVLSRQCPGGYFCSGGSMYPCPIGYQCPEGVMFPLACENGRYSESTESQSCDACPEGYYCDNSISSYSTIDAILSSSPPSKQACLYGSTCEGGTAFRPPCDDGRYYDSDVNMCRPCPAGSYCRGGQIAGECTAGFLCKKNSLATEPDPITSPCPSGYYCKHGVEYAAPCPSDTTGGVEGARQASDCVGCLPGYRCPSIGGSYICPKGKYCPIGGETVEDCPTGTYGDSTGLYMENQCTHCPAGYFCDQEGQTDYTEFRCKEGHYCSYAAVQEVPCPAGTYYNLTGAREEADCLVCPPGFYCPIGTSTPLVCSAGTYCPERSELETTVPGGFYSNKGTGFQMTICPANHRCPRGAKEPELCEGRVVCRVGEELGTLCPAGWHLQDNSVMGTSNQCLPCPAGTYSTLSTDPFVCDPCPPGYLCFGRTDRPNPSDRAKHQGERCPKGYYCEESSLSAEACPPGTFNDKFGAGSIEECPLCDIDSFNDLSGQSGCQPCGNDATSEEGATACSCRGRYRVFSLTDSSCRCQSGFDAVDSSGVSKGQESGSEDCTPLVYARCTGANKTRSPDGRCVDLNDCSAACAGQGGVRSDVVGVCTCNNDLGVDNICNPSCRKTASRFSLDNGITISAGDTTVQASIPIIGKTSCGKGTAGCNVVGAQQDPDGGFQGGYGTPPIITETARRRRQLSSSSPRFLQALESDAKLLSNPIYCLRENDVFAFVISSPRHYPVYLRDSVINTNHEFDYGAFLDLADQMDAKIISEAAFEPIIFSFPFTQEGTYMFVDANRVEQLDKTAEETMNTDLMMVITVMGEGETCQDSDKRVQQISGRTLSSFGVPQSDQIIIEPDYPLLISLGLILLFSTAMGMVLIAYCLHKQWTIAKIKKKGYRLGNVDIDIKHSNKDTYGRRSDFELMAPALKEEDQIEEDDLDNINMEIYQDLVKEGQEFLKTFQDVQEARRDEQREKKRLLLEYLKEIERELTDLGQEAKYNEMYLYIPNSDEEGEDGQLEKQQELKDQRETQAAAARKEQLDRETSERDKALTSQAQEEAKRKAEEAANNLSKGIDALLADDDSSSLEKSIGEGGGVPRNRDAKVLKKIDEATHLQEQEKDELVAAHAKASQDVEALLETEKKKQDSELDAALRARLQRRKKRLAAQGKGAIKEEVDAAKKEAAAQLDEEKKKSLEDAQREAIEKKRLIQSDPQATQEEKKRLTEEHEAEKEKTLARIADEIELKKKEAIRDAEDKIKLKKAQGAQTTEEFEQDIIEVLGKPAKGKQILDKAKQRRKDRVAEKKAELQAQQEEFQRNLRLQREEADRQLKDLDLLQEEEDEKARIEGLKRNRLYDEKERDKELNRDPLDKAVKAVDLEVEKEALADLLQSSCDADALLKAEQAQQASKLEARRNLLKQRRANRQKQKLAEELIEQNVKAMEIADQIEAEANQEYVVEILGQTAPPADNKSESNKASQANKSSGSLNQQQKADEKKAQILNEVLADEDFERLGNMLARQFMEKEQRLKLLLQKYTDQRLAETDHIKANLMGDFEVLKGLRKKNQLDDGAYKEAEKKLQIKEGNLIRDLKLQLDKAHKEEEVDLRKELDQRHADEQVKFKQEQVEKHSDLRNKLLGEKQAEIEKEWDQKVAEQLAAVKKEEQARKERALETQKKVMQRKIEKELNEKIKDHDELLRKKREIQAEAQKEAAEIRRRLEERKLKLEKMAQTGSEEEKKAILARYEQAYNLMSIAYDDSANIQISKMTRRREQRKQRAEKERRMKMIYAAENQSKAEIERAMGITDALSKVNAGIVDENSELLRKLREWSRQREDKHRREKDNRLENTTFDQDPTLLTKVISKLDQVERSLKEFKKLKRERGIAAPDDMVSRLGSSTYGLGRRRTTVASHAGRR